MNEYNFVIMVQNKAFFSEFVVIAFHINIKFKYPQHTKLYELLI